VNVDLRYLGHTEVRSAGGSAAVRFAPNLARPKVFYDGELVHPVRFREAVSALHDVVVGDYRFQKKDKTAYKAWKEQQAAEDAELARQADEQARKALIERYARTPIPPDLTEQFHKMHKLYWHARVTWANELSRNDPELFRHLVPCDPVVTVAPDVVFFEAFAKDESSYGCLTVDRAALRAEGAAGNGTTNVDYSLALYEHFQTLRSYRATRLSVDPSGFDVKVAGREDYREEKIDLPPSWLRGFGQLQAAMGLPSRRVELPVEAVYSLLAYLKRHREKTGPRSIRFVLTPGKAPVLVLDPWNVTIACRGPAYDGPRTEEIKVWGRRRLMALARTLPLCERVEVALLGTGLPSVWIAHMGEMHFVLALSGWTTNDWTSGANLDLLTGGFRTEPRALADVTAHLQRNLRATAGELDRAVSAPREVLLGCLNLLAKQGQLMYDFSARCYRYRQVMPVALSDALIGPEHPELVEGRRIWREGLVKMEREGSLDGGKQFFVAKCEGTSCEGMLDADGVFTRARCTCKYFHKAALRAGPCRHLLALRFQAQGPVTRAPGGGSSFLDRWFQ
jgi:hypothetical protein